MKKLWIVFIVALALSAPWTWYPLRDIGWHDEYQGSVTPTIDVSEGSVSNGNMAKSMW